MFPLEGRKRLLRLLCAPPRRPSPAPVPVRRAIPNPRRGEKDCKGISRLPEILKRPQY
jgi:hypothetical protein